MAASRLQITVQVDSPVIEYQRVVAASPALVFELSTSPDHLRNWWGPKEYEGVSIDIDRPRRLVHTTVYEGAPDSEEVDGFTFDDGLGGTSIRCRSEHSSLATRDIYVLGGMERGLAESHQRSDALIAGLSKPQEGHS